MIQSRSYGRLFSPHKNPNFKPNFRYLGYTWTQNRLVSCSLTGGCGQDRGSNLPRKSQRGDPYKVEFLMISNSKINLSIESGSLWGCEKCYCLLKLNDPKSYYSRLQRKVAIFRHFDCDVIPCSQKNFELIFTGSQSFLYAFRPYIVCLRYFQRLDKEMTQNGKNGQKLLSQQFLSIFEAIS